jgi:hypothetical protein
LSFLRLLHDLKVVASLRTSVYAASAPWFQIPQQTQKILRIYG